MNKQPETNQEWYNWAKRKRRIRRVKNTVTGVLLFIVICIALMMCTVMLGSDHTEWENFTR